MHYSLAVFQKLIMRLLMMQKTSQPAHVVPWKSLESLLKVRPNVWDQHTEVLHGTLRGPVQKLIIQ